MVITQGQLTYIFRGKEMTFDFYPVQPLERLGVAITGVRRPVGDGYRFTLTLTPAEPIVLKSVSVDIAADMSIHNRIFVNGFQSWTESREYDPREKMARVRWPVSVWATPGGDRVFYRTRSRPGRLHGWTYSYIRGADGNIVLFGSVSEQPGYTLFEFETSQDLLRVSRDCEGLELAGTYTALDIVVLPGREDTVFDLYFQEMNIHGEQAVTQSLVAATSSAPMAARHPASAWSSGHGLPVGISEPVILANLAEMRKRKVPLDYFVIDDGWQRSTGDWLSPNSEFPKGMGAMARAIRDSGYRPGLWIAPFVCARWSNVWKKHRDWILKDESGRLVCAGWSPRWGGPFYALDVYNPEFTAYLEQVFSIIFDEWQFELVKMDYLYAAGLRARKGLTRGRTMHDAMELLQRLIAGRTTIASGVPLGPAFGKVTYCRTGATVGPSWEDKVLRVLGHRERATTENAVTSVIGRRHLLGRAFGVDPDAITLGDQNRKMTPVQKRTAFALSLILGDLTAVSDNPALYTAEELALYRSSFPLREKTIKAAEHRRGTWSIRFESEGRQYLFLANLTSKPREFRVDPGIYFDPDIAEFTSIEAVDRVEPFGSKCLLRVPDREWEIAGGTGHIFPGCEAERSLGSNGSARLAMHPHASYESQVFLRVPDHMERCVVNGSELRVERAHGIPFVRVHLGPNV